MPGERIADEEIVYRRIPPTLPFFEDPDRVTSANFKLDERKRELGLSVYRASIVTALDVLTRPDAIPGSRLAEASVGAIRKLRAGDGKPLNLDVLPVDDDDNPGHAEIRPATPGTMGQSAAKALRGLFQLVESA